MDHSQHHEHKMNYAKGYAVLALLVSAITVGAFVSSNLFAGGVYPSAVMRFFMAYFFIMFGIFKLINLKVFAITYAGYDILASRFKAYGYIYPFLELGLGLLYLLGIFMTFANVATLIMMSIGAAGVAKELTKKNRIPCACLGNVVELPLTTVSLTEDLAMAGMALLMLIGM